MHVVPSGGFRSLHFWLIVLCSGSMSLHLCNLLQSVLASKVHQIFYIESFLSRCTLLN